MARFLVNLYEQEGLEPGLEDQILSFKFKEDGGNVLTTFAQMPYSQDLFESLQKIFPGYMDRYRYGYHGDRPLRVAIFSKNLEVARYILDQGPYTCELDDYGWNEVDHCCMLLQDPTDAEDSLKLKSILGLLFEFAPIDAVAALAFPMFQSENSILSENEQSNLIFKVDPLHTDIHGWAISDYLQVVGRDRKYTHVDSSQVDNNSSRRRHKEPSRISVINGINGDIMPLLIDESNSDVKISSSGLEVSLRKNPSLPDFKVL
ncbi:hypothetical protein ABW20_dc0101227 [Dactylellina cionopaga]|nr:hypothetical protein ABW20_dc0101227 [Dactylellina cionopaga]